MRYLALATDYDGTIALDGRVDEPTLAGMERLLASGRKLILVTGRELDDLRSVFSHFELFEWVVAENGALLYRPSNQETTLLADPPPEAFVAELKRRGVGPISVGGVIVATWHPHETAVLETIRDLGLDLQVIFNKGAVMVLPAGVNKATGLKVALKQMALSPHNVVGVGDAENDHAFLNLCECSAAVANALPALKDRADLVLARDHGAGVCDLMDALVASDLKDFESRLTRHHLLLGSRADGADERVRPFGHSLLIAGPSGSGKSTVATGLLERLTDARYQFCVIDPEGDYQSFEGAIVLGGAQGGPAVDEVIQALRNPFTNTVVNLIGLPLGERPGFFQALLPRLLELRATTGRPHWLLIDEAHHLLPTAWQPGSRTLPQEMDELILVTVHPDSVATPLLKLVDTVVAVGPAPADTLRQFCAAVGAHPPAPPPRPPADGEVLVWVRDDEAVRVVRPAPCQTERRRHIRKYAEGELPPDRSFYFRGPEEKLNLRAQNLILFLQLADGVDDATWLHHLRRGDYSRWFRDMIKDHALADDAAEIEKRPALSAAEGRALIRAAVESRYTLPASSFLPMPGTDAAPKWS
jgi:hydroxymethylpyrimidine pyrophosphatase-like HAD family hydrolase